MALLLLPDLALSGGPAAEGATAPWLLYLFGAWACLIGLSFWIGRLLIASAPPPDDAP